MERLDEYAERGDYHRELSKDWAYYPIYKRKTQLIHRLFMNIPKDSKIIDVGCGEGVFVENLKGNGYNILGIDKNYSSKDVIRGSIFSLPFKENQFDVVLCLDVIEHVNLTEQENSLKEIYRIIKPHGMLIMTIPNLAHFYSRIRFLFRGKLARTASEVKHPGDRPISEFLDLLKKEHFLVKKRYGVFPTFPFLFKWMQRKPHQSIWLFNIITRLLPYPNFSFLNVIVSHAKKEVT